MAYFERYMLDESGNLRKVVINAGVGFCLPFYGETAPPGTLACDGSEISREAYKELFDVLGTKAGAGDGASTFNLPDFRGDFIRCVGGNAAELGVQQEDAIRNLYGLITTVSGWGAGQGSWAIEVASIANNVFRSVNTGSNSGALSAGIGGMTTNYGLEFNSGYAVPTADENRPINYAVNVCVVYE